MVSSTLSQRQRDAITLELEDRQKDLVEDLWHLSQGMINRVQVPAAVFEEPGVALAGPWSAHGADRFQALVSELRQTMAALSALRRDQYGRCVHCAAAIPPALLMSDMLRETCPACSAVGGSGEC